MTWPVRTLAGAWNDCYDEPYKHKKCNRHIWARLWPAYYMCDVARSQTQGMTMPHNPSDTAQLERKLNWLCNAWKKEICQREEGYGKMKLHHLHCHSELLL